LHEWDWDRIGYHSIISNTIDAVSPKLGTRHMIFGPLKHHFIKVASSSQYLGDSSERVSDNPLTNIMQWVNLKALIF
jgi:hypothetical protein